LLGLKVEVITAADFPLCHPYNASGDLACYATSDFITVALGSAANLTAMISGIVLCVGASRGRRWGWFAIFLALIALFVAAPTLILLIILDVSLLAPLWDDIPLLWLAVLFLTCALGLLTRVYLGATAGTEQGQNTPNSD
jgi:hypothetical protein